MRLLGRSDLHRRIQQLEDALARSHGGLQHVVFFAEVLDGAEEALRVLHEGHQHAQSDGVAQHRAAAKPDDRGNGAGGKDFHHRVVDGVRHDGVFERVHVGGVDFFELFVSALLAIEKLQHHDAADMLLQIGVDAGDGHANAAIALGDGPAEERRREHDQRQDGYHDRGQRRAELEHGEDDEAESEQVAQDGHEARGEELIEDVDIGGDARDKAADGIAVVESDIELLQMRHQFAAQVEHGLLADVLHDVHLGELEEEDPEQGGEVEHRNLRESGERVGGEEGIDRRGDAIGGGGHVAVDGDLGEQRPGHLQLRGIGPWAAATVQRRRCRRATSPRKRWR